jgi:di/tricarboxylate transporter
MESMEPDEKTHKTAIARVGSKWWVFLLALLAFLAIYWSWPQAEHNQAVVAATLVAVVILWVSEVIPLFVSALIGSCIIIFTCSSSGGVYLIHPEFLRLEN